MGDAVRRVQRHLQELSRDHHQAIEDRHHANLGWLQIELQQLCRQIEVDVRVELTRPPRLSLASKNPGPPPTDGTGPTKALTLTAIDERVTVATPAVPPTAPSATSRAVIKKIVKRTRKVLRPKRIVRMVPREKPPARARKRPAVPPLDVSTLKVAELKTALKQRGLKVNGLKAALALRLQEALDAEDAANAEMEADDAEEDDAELVEVVEEVMEEVEEEYEEEIEVESESGAHEITEAVAPPEPSKADEDVEMLMEEQTESTLADTDSAPPVLEVDETPVEASPSRSDAPVDATASSDAVNALQADRESLAMAREDSDVAETRNAATANDAPVAKITSPKKSLSEMVPSAPDDEIVRESDFGADDTSPSAKTPVPLKVAMPTVHEGNAVEQPDALLPRGKSAAVVAPSDSSSTIDLTSPNVAEFKSTDAIKTPVEPSRTTLDNPQSTRPLTTTTSMAPTTTVATPKPVTASSLLPAVTPSSSVKLHKDDPRAPLSKPSTRNTSVASAASLISPRCTGNISVVEDSQPDQSPHRVSFAPDVGDFPTHSTRSVSTSHLELQLKSATVKTPDASTSVAPVYERVAQSEPRVHTAKQAAEDEFERKRREQQESIEREAQRLRLAAKQSAKKRFEEARASSLFWAKREQMKQQLQSSTPNLRSTPTNPIQNIVSPVRAQVDVDLKQISAELINEAQPSSRQPSTTSVANSRIDATEQVDQSTDPSPSSSQIDDQNTKLRPRKRSSVSVEGDKQSEFPPKKRTSLVASNQAGQTKKRARESDQQNNRDSLSRNRSTRTRRSSTSSEKIPKPTTKRTSLTRDRDLPASTSVSTENKPLQKVNTLSSQLPENDKPSKSTASSTTATGKVSSLSRLTAQTVASLSKRRDSVSSTLSNGSNGSTEGPKVVAQPTTSTSRKPTNLVSGLHSFTSLLEKDSVNVSSSQGSTTSTSSRQAPVVNALKMAEKSRLLEQKKTLEKMKRKEALMKRYEEQRKQDEEKKKKLLQMKEKAEKEARMKREQEKAAEKKQRELELAKKRKQRLEEMRAGLEKKRAQLAAEKEPTKTITAAPVSRIAASSASSSTSKHTVRANDPPPPPTKIHPSKPQQPASSSAISSSAVPRPGGSKELTTYAISENEESSGTESDDDKEDEKSSKNIPKWAQRENLERTLRLQFGPNAIDPTPTIFPDFVDSCDLEAIFEPTDLRKKKRFQRRTSSGNWLADRPTAREKAMYKREMGFQR